MKKIIGIIIVLCGLQLQVHAQSEETYKPCVLELNENGKVKNYVLENFSYNISRRVNDSLPAEKHPQYVYVNFTINDSSNNTFVDWITDPGVKKSGKILIKNSKTGEVVKEFAFEDAYVDNTSESIYSSYMENGSSISLNISCKQFSINRIPVKNAESSWTSYY